MVKSAPMLLRRQPPSLRVASCGGLTQKQTLYWIADSNVCFSALFLMAEQGQEELD